ncbi:MAG: PQQ-binding-like beta-propeller repeat protein, partial [Planctomycetota bacterium]
MNPFHSSLAVSPERPRVVVGKSRLPQPLPTPLPTPLVRRPAVSPVSLNVAFTLAFTLAFALALTAKTSVWAQKREDSNVVAAFRAAPRELSLRLTRAKKAIEEEQYADAVAELGRLLAELDRAADGGEGVGGESAASDAPQDYFIGSRNEQGTHVSLKSEVQRLIGEMPAQGREWFELQFGPEARRMLNEAIEAGDGGRLTSVSRRFFHTKAGYEATLLLGRYYMDQGQPLAAALVLRRLSESPAASGFEPELSLLAATCWIQANQPQRAQTILGALAKTAAGAGLQVGGKPLELPADANLARERLEALLALRLRDGGGPLAQWILFRGDAARTARVTADAPLRNARWRVPTINNPNDERLAEKFAKEMSMQGTPPLPSLQPLAVNDFVLMRTAEGLLGVDVRTGKRVWPYPWDESDPSQTVAASRNRTATRQRVSRETELKQRLFDDAAFGQISSDGDAVYFLHDLPFASTNQQQIMIQMQVRGMNGRGTGSQGNQLVALDTRREGKFLWSIGDGKGSAGDDPRLADAFFLGPPLPVQGKLFVLMEINSEVCVAAIDPKTGKLEWQQQLVQLESRTINVDSNRRLAGSSPSFADGVLVCPTSAGAVVAVDIANRSLLWGFQYSQSQNETPQNGVFFARNMQFAQLKALGQRWNDATVTIDDGRVLVTPVESNEMYCLDLLTGKLLWPAQKRNDLLFVAGVHRGKAVFVGKNNLVAVQMSDGKPAWANPLEIPEKALPSGRGVHAGAHYYLPTTAPQLLKIDMEAGKIVETFRTSEILGNLICYRDEIISHGIGGLAVFPMAAPLREKVAAKLKEKPDDTWALGSMAELKAHAGEYGDAVALLREARVKNPDDQYLRGLLMQNLMNALRDDF